MGFLVEIGGGVEKGTDLFEVGADRVLGDVLGNLQIPLFGLIEVGFRAQMEVVHSFLPARRAGLLRSHAEVGALPQEDICVFPNLLL